ncbi:Stp1/IreP family PP2C-type Ser/Thr phosphatase [uncultured Amnibacterium sp.]|uniref:Stp1/IreP family PP2C-type Ser/Thr phosphatase n=1 Tax=uncultured Amnibacterium sp. TaxID=1631851 RepID=UPI0035CB875F
MTIVTAAAAVSHVGRVRANNQDSGYAGRNLFVVADGMGGHAGGDVASAIAVTRIAEADALTFSTPQQAEFALQSALVAANQLINETVSGHPELTGMGTTVSALVRVGDTVVTAHIGDSRIYLLRDGELSQITNDHTFVQRLVETGRITPEEAAVHPRRSVLMRVLGDIDQAPEIDTSIIGTVPADRWMICSDGLSSYVSEERILAVLSAAGSAAESADWLVREALEHGAPDNVTVIAVDIDHAGEPAGSEVVVGSAAEPLNLEETDPHRQHLRLPSLLLHPVRSSPREAVFEPAGEDYLDALIRQDARRIRRRRLFWLLAVLIVVIGALVAVIAGYSYTQTQYYVGFDGDRVAIFQGVQPQLGPIRLSHVKEETDLTRDDLQQFYRARVSAGVQASSLADARTIVATRLGQAP